MSIKLSLDVPAVERLFKDDKELEVKLKQGVILNFVDRYLRNLLKDEFLQAQIKEAKEVILKTVEEEIMTIRKDNYGRNSYVDLKPDFKKVIKDKALIDVNDAIVDLVKKSIANLMDKNAIDKYIETAVENKLNELTKSEVQKRANDLLKQL
jgi:hypothetical protein